MLVLGAAPHKLLRGMEIRPATQAPSGASEDAVRYFWPGLLPRNLLFLVVVLLHGFRRLLPPF